MTAIIVLNWNGFQDTIECLASLFACTKQDFTWVVVDNGSENESVREITSFLNGSGKDFSVVKQGEAPSSPLKAGQGIVYCLKENYGFAKGNNLGIALVEQLAANAGSSKPSHYLLLNNDTLVEPDFLEQLESFAEKNPKYVALTPQIRYAEPRNKVWNCGGKMVFGLRIYLYENKMYSSIKEKHFMPISLITGCALFVKRELLGFPDAWLQKKSKRYAARPHSDTEATDLLSNRFFFGEEDFDFSLRLQDQNKKMVCVLDSVIYHKAGKSRKQFLPAGHLYMHHLNRFVDVRQHWHPFKFFIWKLIYMPYIFLALWLRDKIGIKEIFRYQRNLWKESAEWDGMDKDLFHKWIFSK
ncbi:MAG: glycosyltransferase family 2 protein [Bacteroidales bacterium]|nr:glycosyltransferase family 2 protein [Bacteroidales bacterium]